MFTFSRQQLLCMWGVLSLSGSTVHYAICQAAAPRYNEVYQKNTHNAYWLDVASPDPEASGTQERLIDQILHEGVRSFELDIHFEGGHAGEFTVYHTLNATLNSTCHYLTNCLDLFQRFDYLEPNHEVITIVLEFKETVAGARVFGTNGVIGPLKQDHHLEDLDRQLWEHLGPRLYTPGELLANPQCAGLSLRRCIGKVGWPTLDQLRGRYIVTVIGNWEDNYWDWIDYANNDGGIVLRAAFPLRSMLVSNIDDMKCWSAGKSAAAPIAGRDKLRNISWHPEIELDSEGMCLSGNHPYILDKLGDPTFKQQLLNARDASIFWQVEKREFENLPEGDPNSVTTFLDSHGTNGNLMGNGVARLGDQGETMFVPVNQLALIKQQAPTYVGAPKYQIFQTDFPWNFIHSRQPGAPTSLPTPNRPMFQKADVIPDSSPTFDSAYFSEPGARLYFHALADNRWADATLSVTGDTQWEVQPSNTAPTHDSKLPPLAKIDSSGCLYARAKSDSDEVRICRTQQSDERRSVRVYGWAMQNGKRSDFSWTVPHQEPSYRDGGDLLMMRVTGGGKRVQFWTAGTMAPSGNPRWNLLPQGDFTFSTPLLSQGLSAQGDVLFVKPMLNGVILTKQSFSSLGTAGNSQVVEDLSYCANGECFSGGVAQRGTAVVTGRDIAPYIPAHETIYTSSSGQHLVSVHETEGRVFGQWRTLYTTDRFEMTNSGLYQFQTIDDFLLLRDTPKAGDPLTPLYKCLDWRRDYHQHWLSTDPLCPNPNTKDAFAENGGRIGYIATIYLPGTKPLYHLRKGTKNDGSADTHDHYFAVGDAERDIKINKEGYSLVGTEPVGWVYVKQTNAQLTVLAKAQPNAGCGKTIGIVTSAPAGITCQINNADSSCIATFPINTIVTLTGVPRDPISRFEGFSGGCSGTTTCTFTIVGDTSVTATFCGLIP